ncbi:MAG: ribosomal protein S18-alanine N-acetyltransferase [Sphaerobacter sp.]|nr:ribosomal protein S18-alanine N-acetyltransferase [Sphaerobacter sp.]
MDSEKTIGTDSYYVEPMRIDDVPAVSRLERRCFTNPWPESAYRRELRNPANNFYVVLRWRSDRPQAETSPPEPRGRLALLPLIRRPEPPVTDSIVGFAGMWILYDEAHVTTIAVAPEHRGRGLGELLLVTLFDEAIRRRAEWVTLEVRVSNAPAQALYEKYGFTRQGLRKRYYSDNGEDAYIMWSPSLRDPAYQQRYGQLRERLFERLAAKGITAEKHGLPHPGH